MAIMDEHLETHSKDTDPTVASVEKGPVKLDAELLDGGARAWGVAVGSSGVLFATFGYANAFGYVFESMSRPTH